MRPGASPFRGLSWVALVVVCVAMWTITVYAVWWAGAELCEAMAGWCE